MRVLYISRGYTPHDRRFLDAMARGGHEPFHLRLRPDAQPSEELPLPEGVVALEAPGRAGRGLLRRRRALPPLRRILREVEPDVVQAGPLPDCAFQAARARARPLVSMSWGWDLLDSRVGRSQLRRTRFALAHSSVLIGDCQAVRDRAVTWGGFPEERVVVFPWGVDLASFRPSVPSPLRERLGWTGATVFLCNRAWEPGYHVGVALRAFRGLHERFPDARLLLLGDGSERGDVDAFIRANGLGRVVERPGRVPNADMPKYLACADVYLSPAPVDGSSVSLMEAMACALPVVVADNPSNREWVGDREDGLLFPAGDAAALQDRMERLADDEHSRRRLGQAALAVARRRADWEKNRTRLSEAYRLATEDPGGAGA